MYRPLTGGWQNTAELETISKLNLSLTLSGRLRWAISLVLIDAINPKLKIIRHKRVLTFYPERKKPVKN